VVMCRAKAITYDNLAVRDPAFVARVDDAFYARVKYCAIGAIATRFCTSMSRRRNGVNIGVGRVRL
jgi:hypothetical protein